jgi:ankyrin repeat protein
LSLAARAGHLTTVKLLLDEEVNRACRAQFTDWPVTTIRAMDNNTTAIESMTMLTSEQIKFVEDAKKTIVNQTDNNGCTPLISAAGQYHREVVTYLLQEGSILCFLHLP